MFRVMLIAALVLASASAARGPIEHEEWFQSQRSQPRFEGEIDKRPAIEDHVVGDTMSLWAFDMSGMPPEFILLPATCRGVSEHSYVFVDNNQWNVNITQTDVDTILAHWDDHTPADPNHGVFYLDSAFFGAPPDVFDNDEHIYIFYYDMGGYGDGYFGSYNQYPDTFVFQYWSPPGFWHSNEIEMIYMSTTSSGGPSSPLLLSVLAHEFEHLIHWGFDEDEDTWVDEGCAEYAMVLYGYPDPTSPFTSNTDIDLTTWASGFADYSKVLLFFTYLAEQYATPQLLPEIVRQTGNSVDGVDAAFAALGYSDSVSSVLPDWAVANYLDDTTLAGGRYGYVALDVGTPSPAASVSSFPWNSSLSLNAWAGEYVMFWWDTGAVDISFDGDDGATYHNRVLKIDFDDVYPTEVIETPLGAGNTWSGTVPGLSDPFERIVHVTARNSSSGGTGYAMTADLITSVTGDDAVALPNSISISASPNPFNPTTVFAFDLPRRGRIHLDVYDILGRIVASVADGEFEAGSHTVRWDAGGLASGVYTARLSTGAATTTTRAVLLK
jgi:hypothetical protein